MYRVSTNEEVTAPIWEGHPEDATTGMRPRPIATYLAAPEPSMLPPWLDAALRDPAVGVAGAALLGLLAAALSGTMGFLLGLIVA